MEIQVKEFIPPIISINYQDLKAELEKNLEIYKGLVVTEETLAASKATQKELAGLRKKIDTYRKEKKKEIEAPIKQFEEQCKELIELVEKVEKPIKDGILFFDNLKKEEKKQKALEIIKQVAESMGLNEKFTRKLDVLEKYTNLTATEKAVREDAETRAFALKIEQEREAERLEIIESVIDSENARLRKKIMLNSFQKDIDSGISTSDIITRIKDLANIVYEAENKPIEPPKEAEPKEVLPQEKKGENEQIEQQYTATYKLVGTVDVLRSVSRFLKENGICYEVLEQREIL